MWKGLRQRWRAQRAGEGFLNPLYFAVGVRWITWIDAFGIIALGAASEVNLRYGYPLLAVTGLQLVGMTGYIPLQARLGPWLATRFLVGLDIFAALVTVYLSGGWDSPFYEFALTSVITPSLAYGLRGATAASIGFCLGYMWVLAHAGRGASSFYTPEGRLQGALVSCLINPFMVAYFSAFLAEVTERLKQEQERVRVLAAREERSRLAREIHDGVAQTMFMLTLSLEACMEHARRANQEPLAGKLEGLVSASRNALWEIRNSMFDMGPLLEGAPLKDSLARLFKEFQTVSQMPLELTCQGSEPPLSLELRVGLYRIVSESLANACKHSLATAVKVQLDFGPEGIQLVVEDNGKGFEPETVTRGRGLANLQARAQELKGQLSVTSTPGQGTRIELRVPS